MVQGLKVRQSRKKIMVFSILPKKRTKLFTILSTEDAQDSEFRSFFGRIEDTINCFRDLLTFKKEIEKENELIEVKMRSS